MVSTIISFNQFLGEHLKRDFYSWSYNRQKDYLEQRQQIAKNYDGNVNAMQFDNLAMAPYKKLPELNESNSMVSNMSVIGVLTSFFGITTLLKAPFNYCKYRIRDLSDSGSGFWWQLGLIISSPLKIISMLLSPIDTLYSLYGKLTNYGMPHTGNDALTVLNKETGQTENTTDTIVVGNSYSKTLNGLDCDSNSASIQDYAENEQEIPTVDELLCPSDLGPRSIFGRIVYDDIEDSIDVDEVPNGSHYIYF